MSNYCEANGLDILTTVETPVDWVVCMHMANLDCDSNGWFASNGWARDWRQQHNTNPHIVAAVSSFWEGVCQFSAAPSSSASSLALAFPSTSIQPATSTQRTSKFNLYWKVSCIEISDNGSIQWRYFGENLDCRSGCDVLCVFKHSWTVSVWVSEDTKD